MAEQRHISRDMLEEMFAGIQAETPWDVNGNMLWGYFFTGPNKGDLEKIGAELGFIGYHLVEIRECESTSSQGSAEWQLHVERVEFQTVDTLLSRNTQFEDLASRYRDIIYDGMDVGPAE